MSSNSLPFSSHIVDVPTEEFQALSEHLEQELERDYAKSKVNKGRRLYAAIIKSVELIGEDGTAVLVESGEDIQVQFNLPVFDLAGGYSTIRCSCQRETIQLEPERCHHMWIAQYALKAAIGKLLEGQQNDKVAANEFFTSIERLVQSSDKTSQPRLERIRFTFDHQGKIKPIIQKYLGSQWSGGRQIPVKDVLSLRRLWLGEPIASFIPLIHPISGEVEDLVAGVQALSGTGSLVKFEQPDQAMEVLSLNVILQGRIHDEGFQIQPLFSNKAEIKGISESGLIGWDFEKAKVFIAALDSELLKFYEGLWLSPTTIPVEQQDKLVQYLSQLGNRVAISLDNISETVESVNRLYLRLTPLPSGVVKGEILVKPSDTGGYFMPGIGPEEILDLSDPNQPKNVVRDLWREQDLAMQVAEDLRLQSFSQSQGVVILPDEQAVLGILDKLRISKLEQRVVIEWPESAGKDWQKDYELGGKLDQDKISLAIGGEKDWFQVQGEVEFAGESLSLQELLKALKKGRKYIQLKSGQWARITEAFAAKLEKIADSLDEDDENLHANPTSAVGLEESEEEGILLKEASKEWWALQRKLRNTVAVDDSLPKGLQAHLRDYQKDGFRWLNRLVSWGMGACLADDMGLGKTIQTLTVLLKHASRGPSLVIAPLSVVANWEREMNRFCPSLRPIQFRDQNRTQLLKRLMPFDVVIASYGLVWRDSEQLNEVDWNLVVLDEAQNIKNARSKTAKAVQTLPAQSKIALSGTPIENHLGDLWSLFRTINPSLLGSWERFKRVFGFPISRDHCTKAQAKLSSRIAPFVLRRLKNDYLKELPPKTEINLEVSLSEPEMDVYQAIRIQAAEKLTASSEEESDESQRLQVLAALTKLRQAACHPKLVMDTWDQTSSKLELFANIANQIVDNGHRALVFSQFTRHLEIARQKLDELGYQYSYLDGSMANVLRQKEIDQFQNGGREFFLISLKAGGTGITLTEADFVIHLDPWWNPAIEDQATDRAYRMGQTKPVTVYRLITRNTVEELILKLHQQKRGLADAVLAGADKTAQIDMAQLKKMIVQPEATL